MKILFKKGCQVINYSHFMRLLLPAHFHAFLKILFQEHNEMPYTCGCSMNIFDQRGKIEPEKLIIVLFASN